MTAPSRTSPGSDDVRRRDFLRAAGSLAGLFGLGALLGTAPGCDGATVAAGRFLDPLPDRVGGARDAVHAAAFHLLARAAMGPRPGDVERLAATGRDAWLDEQLAPDRIDDGACRFRVAECEHARSHPMDLAETVTNAEMDRDLTRHALLMAVHSRCRIRETMVVFWSDHFSIQTAKRGCRETKPTDDREVIRPHALGRFRDLLRASATSPAMLYFLDGAKNRVRRPGDKPNENYARELLELHTLGVRGGYTQRDVMEVARCLSGWTVEDRGAPRHWAARGTARFDPSSHDDGEKEVLGVRIPAGGGPQDLEDVIDLVCRHPSTARHLAVKLVRKFVADDPPADLVESTAQVFSRTEGDIAATVRHVLTSPAFDASAGTLVKRPFEFVVSALRATGAECRATPAELRFLERLGHVPFHHPTPDGYPLEPGPWMGTLLWRWNFALALTTGGLGATRADLHDLLRRVRGAPEKADRRRAARGGPSEAPLAVASLAEEVASLAPLFLGREPSDAERAALATYAARSGGTPAERRAELAALLLCTPAFQTT